MGSVLTFYTAGIGENVLIHQFFKTQKERWASVSAVKKKPSSLLPPGDGTSSPAPGGPGGPRNWLL